MLANINGKLMRAHIGKLKNFGCGVIRISFSLERIPLLTPQQSPMDPTGPQEPHMLRWVALMAHHGGDCGAVVPFTPKFFYMY